MVAGFAAVILAGALLLLLPWSRGQGGASPVDALFISTSAVCVTGLSTVDFPAYYSGLGHVVVALLIQVGGLGVMTGAALVYRAVGRRLSLRSQAALQDSLIQEDSASGFWPVFRAIVLLTFAIEAVGAVLLFFGFVSQRPLGEAVSAALFHAVSAFCNAGFSTYGDSLMGFRGRPLVVGTVMGLIVLGGLGGLVLVELRQYGPLRLRGRPSMLRLTLHTRAVLAMTAFLIVAGTVLLLAFGLTPDLHGPGAVTEAALFQSVTARTAGFNTVAIGSLPIASLLLLIALMFIGGSPGSCAGGVKTTTAVIWGAELWSALRRRNETVVMDRVIPPTIVRRALLLVNLSVLFNFVGVLLLLLFERGTQISPIGVFFEQISAFGTVGLSTGITPDLSALSKLWLVATMFVGRLGPLVLASFALRARTAKIRPATGRLLIG